jgi:hypothetical protein
MLTVACRGFMRVTRARTVDWTVGRTEVEAEVAVRGVRRTVRVGRGVVGRALTAPAIVETILLAKREVPGPGR